MQTNTYLFQPEKKFLKQGFFMEDENKNIIYEAKVLKQSLLGSQEVNFINHKTNNSEEHKIGGVVTTNQSGLFEMFSTKSSFKYDGKNIWDYLHEKGIRIDSQVSGNKIGMTYNITFEGQSMATIASTTPGGKSIMTSAHCYNVTTSDEYLDLAFLTTYAIAKTEQVFYN